MTKTLYCLKIIIKFAQVIAMEEDEFGQPISQITHHFGKGTRERNVVRLRLE